MNVFGSKRLQSLKCEYELENKDKFFTMNLQQIAGVNHS